MSRSGYWDDYDDENNSANLYRGTVARTLGGKRGQAFLIEMRDALEAMPIKRLISDELATSAGEVCAIGSVGRRRGTDMTGLDPEDPPQVAAAFGISETMAREVAFMNDDLGTAKETPEQRHERVLGWVKSKIKT